MPVVILLGIRTEILSKIDIPLELIDGPAFQLELDEVLTLAVSSSTEAFTNAGSNWIGSYECPRSATFSHQAG